MKPIRMRELKVGDIFTHEMKLNGREAFKVTKMTPKQCICDSRNTGNEVKKQIKGNVILLRETK
jgi:hypothetical protein